MNTNIDKDKSQSLFELYNYQLLEVAGEGSFGRVYKALQKSTGQVVAVKIFRSDLYGNGEAGKYHMAKFEREVGIYASVNHPYIVKILDKGYTSSGVPFVVFEYISGVTLKGLIQQQGGLPPRVVKELMGQVLDALVCAHAGGIVHGDLKPQNIMISQTGTKAFVKVLDFGIGNILSETQHALSGERKEALGTPLYAAPEQLRGETPSVKSDLYSWGLMLIECLTGQPAIKGSTMAEIYYEQLNMPEVDIPSFIMEHPLRSLLKRVLDKNAQTRVADAKVIAEEFNKTDFNDLSAKGALLPHTHEALAETVENVLSLSDVKREKKQLTVLSVRLGLSVTDSCRMDEETLEAMQYDQMNICTDAASRYSGYVFGKIADHVVIYFGYPRVNDNDARLAACAALEILSIVQKRSKALYRQYSVELEVRLAIHSGMIVTKSGQIPEGTTPNVAFELLRYADKGKILVSNAAHQLLEPYMEFEKYQSFTFNHTKDVFQTYLLTGERPMDAFSQLRSSKAGRKMHGRDAEFALLDKAWKATGTEGGKAVLIAGEAGIGKSRLVAEFKKEIRQGQGEVLEARCLPEHRNDSLYPILEWLKKYIGLSDNAAANKLSLLEAALNTISCDVAGTLPVVASWLGIDYGDAYTASQLSPMEQKAVLTSAIMQCFTATGQKRLMILEDLHWADPSTMVFLGEFIKASSKGSSGMVVLTSRSGATDEMKAMAAETIMLAPLKAADASLIVAEVLGNRNIERSSLLHIIDRTDGVPIFIEEYTSMLLAKGELIVQEDVYRLREGYKEHSVPLTLRQLLLARLDHLGLAKESAQLASAIGREAEFELMQRTSLKDEANLHADLEQLLHADVMYRVRATSGDIFIFRHALFREVAYESQTSAARKQTHGIIAEALEKDILQNTITAASQTERLASHLYESGRVSDSIDWLMKTAETLVRRSASQETVDICRKALAWLMELPATAQTKQRELALRQMLLTNLITVESYGSPAVGAELDAITQLLDKMEEREELFPSMFLYSNYYMMRGNLKGAVQLCKQLSAQAEKLNNSQWVIVASAFLGMHLFHEGQFAEAAKVLERAISLFDPEKHQDMVYGFGLDMEILAYSVLASVYVYLGREDEVAAIEAYVCEKAERLDHLHSKASLYLGLSCTYYYVENKEKVRKYSEALTLLNKTHNMHMFGNYAGILHAWSGADLEGAKKALEAEEASGAQSMRSFWYSIIADLEIRSGNAAEAIERLKKCLSFIGVTDGALYEADIYRLLGKAFLILKEEQEASKYISLSHEVAVQKGAVLVQAKLYKLKENLHQEL